MTARYVRETYRVPAKRGMRVTVDGRPGVIVSFPGAHLGVRMDGQRSCWRGPGTRTSGRSITCAASAGATSGAM